MFPILVGKLLDNSKEPWYLSGGIAAANCVAAYAAKGAASLAASYVNLTGNATYNCSAPVAAPTWNATDGWIFNGSTQYLTTGVTPVNDLTWSAICRFSGGTDAAYQTIFGYYYDNDRGFRITNTGDGEVVIYSNGKSISPAPKLLGGILAIAGNKGYRDGVVDTGTIAASSGDLGVVFIGSLSNRGDPALFYFGGKMQLIAFYNKALSATEVGVLTTAMAAV